MHLFIYVFAAALCERGNALTFHVPTAPPANSSKQLDPAPIGVSLEFFTFPEYMNDVASTKTCLRNFQDLTGVWPPVRVGGTTQDRATFDPSSPNEVTYSVADPKDAPATLTFGPSFISLAAEYAGKVILGLNRRLNNQPNTLAAAEDAICNMKNLDAIELGNEPNFYTDSDPIAGGSWNASKDFASQASWQQALGTNTSTNHLVSAGVYFGTDSFNNAGLIEVEDKSIEYVKYFCSHNYPQSSSTANLSELMSHSAIAKQIQPYKSEIAAANGQGKSHIMGETNSATQGGGGISPTFGAGLWLMDYSIQLLLAGTRRLYFHQGTVGNCQYCWWGRYDMGAPYYGAYFATMALAGADQVAPLDDDSTLHAAYAIYRGKKAVRVLLYNSEYYTSGRRSILQFTLTGLRGKSAVSAKRLTAPYATSRQDQGQNPSVAGQTFGNGTCDIEGTSVVEKVAVRSGKAEFTVGASEALLIYL